jgi:hypothetical protein
LLNNCSFVISITKAFDEQIMREKSSKNQKVILIIADCYHGVLNAGRFAIKHLFDENSKIVLLQTYDAPATGESVINKISPLLNKIADRELNEFKGIFLKEFKIAEDNIETFVRKGELDEVLNSEFGSETKFSIALGADNKKGSDKIPCRKVIDSLMVSPYRPIFLINHCITVIEEARILTISGEDQQLSGHYCEFIKDIVKKYEYQFEIITSRNDKKIPLNIDSSTHFKFHSEQEMDFLNSSDRLFYDQVLSVSPVAGINDIN